jgi:hypothetical protein
VESPLTAHTQVIFTVFSSQHILKYSLLFSAHSTYSSILYCGVSSHSTYSSILYCFQLTAHTQVIFIVESPLIGRLIFLLNGQGPLHGPNENPRSSTKFLISMDYSTDESVKGTPYNYTSTVFSLQHILKMAASRIIFTVELPVIGWLVFLLNAFFHGSNGTITADDLPLGTICSLEPPTKHFKIVCHNTRWQYRIPQKDFQRTKFCPCKIDRRTRRDALKGCVNTVHIRRVVIHWRKKHCKQKGVSIRT